MDNASVLLSYNASDTASNILEQLDIKPGWLALTLFMMAACLVSNSLLIYIIASRKHLRRQPSKWLLLNLAVCILVKGLLLTTREHLSKTGLPDWSHITSMCVPLDIIHTLKIYMVPIATFLVSSERLACMLSSTYQHSGFGWRTTVAALIGGWLVAIVFTLLSVLVVGQFIHREVNGALICQIKFTPISIYMFLATFNILSLLVLGLTLAIVCVYFKRASSDYLKHNVVMAAVIPNAIYCTLKTSTYGLYLLYYTMGVGRMLLVVWFNVYFSYIFLVPLGWMLGSRELRVELRRLLCPCCPQSPEAEEDIILGDEQTSVYSYYVSSSPDD